MKKLVLLLMLAAPVWTAGAVDYIVGRDGSPAAADDTTDDGLGRVKRMYIYGGYGLHFAENSPEAPRGSAWSGNINAGIGARFTESVRAELAYERYDDEYKNAGHPKTTGHFGFLNFILDANLAQGYRMFKTSPFVPFAGFGAGMGVFGPAKDMKFENEATFAYNLIGGVSLEFNRTIAMAITYKYARMLPNTLNYGGGAIKDLAPASHNAGIGIRMNF